MSARWIDDDTISVVATAASFLTATKINRPGGAYTNVVRVFNSGANTVYYGFGGNQNPPVAPNPGASPPTGIALASGGVLDVDVFDNLQNMQFICSSGQSTTLYILYGTQ
jgi:hypothetical protein